MQRIHFGLGADYRVSRVKKGCLHAMKLALTKCYFEKGKGHYTLYCYLKKLVNEI